MTSNPKMAQQICLRHRPSGLPEKKDFSLVEVALQELKKGDLLVKNLCMSVDPYMRPRMYDKESYVEPFSLDKPLEGQAIGVVVESRHPDWKEGDMLSSFRGWRDYFIVSGDDETVELSPEASEFDRTRAAIMRLPLLPLSPLYFLGALGGVGLTAYVGLTEIGQCKAGDTVLISGAAGGVGHLAGQIAKILGCYVIGSAGSDKKCEFLTEKCGYDVAFNYKTRNLDEAIQAAAPQGIDVYFDNVGGDLLNTATNHMRENGRIVTCGNISDYNSLDGNEAGLKNYFQVIAKQLTIKGFIVTNYTHVLPEFNKNMVQWIEQGRIHFEYTLYDGLDKSIDALQGLFSGENLGKSLVDIALTD